MTIILQFVLLTVSIWLLQISLVRQSCRYILQHASEGKLDANITKYSFILGHYHTIGQARNPC